MNPPLSLAVTAAALTLTLALPLRGSQARTFQNGQSFYVVVVRAQLDTSLFRVCQAGSQQTRSPDLPGLELRPALEARAADATIEGRIEAEFQKHKRFRVAATLDRADYVFFAEATFIRTTGPTDPSILLRAGGDAQPDALMSIVALALPATAYARSEGNGAALLRARLWEGASFGADSEAVSPEDVVLQLHGDPEHPKGGAISRLNGRSICSTPQPERAPVMPAEAESVPDVREGMAAPVLRPDKSPVATFRTRVVAVAVPVVASNRQGGPVGGLNAADFNVFEDDVPQRIDRMTAESEPFTAALVMDTSYSMVPRLAQVKAAASAFIDALRPEDRALAVTFDSRTWLVCDVTGDKDALRRAIVRLQPFGALTRVHDALDLVTGERLDKIAGRKAMVVLTDGMDVGSQIAGAGRVMARLEAANVPVYAVQFESSESRKNRPQASQTPRQPATTAERYFDRIISFDHATEYLDQIARNTGGLLLPASTPDAIVEAFRRAADDVRSQYVLYYYPTNQRVDGAFRHIRVEVKRPGVTVRARAGYRAPGPGQQ